MENPIRCPRCGTELTAGSPEKLCPRCLMQAGLDSAAPHLSPPTAAYSPGFEAPSPEELAPFFPQLEILELLGRGGMGAVYKARQPGLDRLVALKILPPNVGTGPAFAERFQREARALAKLNHPNIVGVFDFGTVNGLYYFLMEFVDGVNLRQAMRAKTLTSSAALKIVPQICDALQFAHEEGVVHRDIKPENILLDKRGRVKIADFGLAKLLDAKANVALTQTNQVMGTPHYMAPEQIQGTRGVDHRADIYSLGVTFYEMLTGELPLGRFAPPSTKVQIDVRLDEVVLRAMEVEPEKRYQHASEVKTELEHIGGLAPGALTRAFGKEYKSKISVFGIPLLHIAFGFDPRTGRKRIAKGIFAFGDIAVGGFAFGGVAMGGLCFGGMSLGLVSIAGLALGLVGAIGGVAIGSVAWGGMALGGVAMGGMAIGYYAYGADGWAIHGLLGMRNDPQAFEFFHPWAHQWSKWLVWLSMGFPVLFALLFAFIWFVFRFMDSSKEAFRSETDEHRLEISNPPADAASQLFRWKVLGIIAVLYAVSFILPAFRLYGRWDTDLNGRTELVFNPKENGPKDRGHFITGDNYGWQCFGSAWDFQYTSWYANPVFWVGCILLASRKWLWAGLLGLLALIFALTAWDPFSRSLYLMGYWVWVVSIALLPCSGFYSWGKECLAQRRKDAKKVKEAG